MEKLLKKNNFILTVLVVLLLLFGSLAMADTADAATKIGTVTIDIGLNVRTEANTNSERKGGLDCGETFIILETIGDWYKISYDGGIIGYVHSGNGLSGGPYVSVSTVEDYVTDDDFEAMLTAEGFPESYKVELRKLHAAHPNWIFKSQNTGLDWEEVIAKESKVGTNLVHTSADDSWKSKEYGAYNWETGEYVVFDSGGWVAASEGIVRYYMDPRNFLNEGNIFLFLQQSYNPVLQTEKGMQTLVANTFLANAFPESGYSTYSAALIYAAEQSGVNPYVLASMILVEQGSDGRGKSISGTVSGFEGYYNHFNIRAYASGGYDAVQYGLLYAKEQGWDTRLKSIVGGAKIYANGYINNKQDTLYLKKFNVRNGLSKVGTHQYMTNVSGAVQEAANLKKGYNLNSALSFSIPVYSNMPAVASTKPVSGNNDYFLKDLSVAGYNLLPAFNRNTEEYEITVPSNVTKVSVSATANDKTSKVSGTGDITLTGDSTEIKVTVTASSGATKVYKITVGKESNTVETLYSSTYNIGSYIMGVDVGTTVSKFISKITVPSEHTIKIYDKSNNEISTNDIITTGCRVALFKGNKDVKSILIVIKGDISGDGKIDTKDVIMAKRHTVNMLPRAQYELTGAYFKAADIDGNGSVNTTDIIRIKRDIVGMTKIIQ